jgi:hypothetical protein
MSKVFFGVQTEGEVRYALTLPIDTLLERYSSRSPKVGGFPIVFSPLPAYH